MNGASAAAAPGTWQVLMALDVVHDWYARAGQAGLRWQPDATTARWLQQAGALVRQQGDTLLLLHAGTALPPPPSAWHAEQRDEAGRPIAPGFAEPLPLRFVAFASDTRWFHVTEDLPADATQVAHFSAPSAPSPSAAGSEAGNPQILLRTGSRAIENPLGGTRPALVASLPVPSAKGPAPAPAASAAAATRWRIHLGARATVWKYLLVGEWGRNGMRIVDLDEAVQFGAPEPEALADGNAALAIRSAAPIAAAERASYRFQLVGRREPGAPEQPIVRRLPLAEPSQLALERSAAGGGPTLVSEILVHR